ncbi:hypothetical protein [Flavobacterium sp. UBA4197]|uniref:hypothetical protein n=1 Tax=Flavobacterium sp. UBA4197 TaxID=1946546 RepID=UPI00257D6CE7|nr:hypothetical protein [Flavobacterium sp. UBA4197]
MIKKDNWAIFNPKNKQHKYILSLCIQKGWGVENDRYGEIADLDRLSNWLKSDKSPVRKPLKKMSSLEVSKIISALEIMNAKRHS